MSKSRLHVKLHQSDEYPALRRYLDKVGFHHTLHTPTGKGHPFIMISLPHGGQVKHHINCTPHCSNPKGALARLRRALRRAGYDLGV